MLILKIVKIEQKKVIYPNFTLIVSSIYFTVNHIQIFFNETILLFKLQIINPLFFCNVNFL